MKGQKCGVNVCYKWTEVPVVVVVIIAVVVVEKVGVIVVVAVPVKSSSLEYLMQQCKKRYFQRLTGWILNII